jgi:hypothetical protein
LSDVDSIGQMCTQIFCGEAGLYKTDAAGNQITFFSGNPVKSTARWMNLTKGLNYADKSLLPMGGSACFYAMIEVKSSSELVQSMSKYAGKKVTNLFIKFMIHEVYEIREPNYALVPTKSIYDFSGNQTLVPKNPAKASISGSITPYFEGDMKTASISRVLKNNALVNLDTSSIPKPKTKAGNELSVPDSVNLAPVQLVHNAQFNTLSLDILNTINEYGSNPTTLANFAGQGDIPSFSIFESYDYKTLSIIFNPDSNSEPVQVGSIDFMNNYNMRSLLSTGGMVDIPVGPNTDFSKGFFTISINGTTILTEDDYYITSDQMGNYAQQNQLDYNYMSDGLPKTPCVLRVFYRGNPVSIGDNLKVTQQNINMRTGSVVNVDSVLIYDGLLNHFAVDDDGCITYAFVTKTDQLLTNNFSNLFSFVMNNSLIVLRTLESRSDLDQYINGTSPITWEVVYKYVFSLFKTLYPVMEAIIPFTEANWSNSFILNKMLVLIDDSNWNQPLYMPVTRDLSAQQVELLKLWANQNMINPTNLSNEK